MDSYIGQIRIVPWKTIPRGWLPCSGQVLNISQNQALYSLIGVTYGGDGKTTFHLPNLNGRVIMGTSRVAGNVIQVGTSGGATSVTLTAATLPPHQHTFQVSNTPGTTSTLAGNICAEVATGQMLYGPMTANVIQMSPGIVDTAGGGAAHTNMQPYMALAYIICTAGLYPPRAD